MPREVNYLTHSSAGILSKKFVTEVNHQYPRAMVIAVLFLLLQMVKWTICEWCIHYDTEKYLSSRVST